MCARLTSIAFPCVRHRVSFVRNHQHEDAITCMKMMRHRGSFFNGEIEWTEIAVRQLLPPLHGVRLVTSLAPLPSPPLSLPFAQDVARKLTSWKPKYEALGTPLPSEDGAATAVAGAPVDTLSEADDGGALDGEFEEVDPFFDRPPPQ